MKLSSSTTFFWKFIFLGLWLWVPLFYIAQVIWRWLVLSQPISSSGNPLGFLLFIVFAGLVWWRLAPLKKVHLLSGGSLLISNYLKTIEVPLSEVESVETMGFWGWQPQTITLTLKSESGFGKEIVYISRGAGLNAKPFADELRQMITSR